MTQWSVHVGIAAHQASFGWLQYNVLLIFNLSEFAQLSVNARNGLEIPSVCRKRAHTSTIIQRRRTNY